MIGYIILGILIYITYKLSKFLKKHLQKSGYPVKKAEQESVVLSVIYVLFGLFGTLLLIANWKFLGV
jgi:hypothetical protein